MANRKPVERVNKAGKVVDVFPSARDAAKRCYLSKSAVLRRANGEVLNPYALDGHDYRYQGDQTNDTEKG